MQHFVAKRFTMKKSILAFSIAMLGLASPASAQPLMNYTYADVAYQWTDINSSYYSGANGVDTKLSYSPIEHFALQGGYNYSSASVDLSEPGDPYKFDINENLFTYGGAGWYSIRENLDIVARVGGIYARASISGSPNDETFSDNGVYTGLTLRYLAMDQLETDAFVTYDHISGDSWSYGLTGLYALHENVALKAEWAMDDQSDIALLGGVRLAM